MEVYIYTPSQICVVCVRVGGGGTPHAKLTSLAWKSQFPWSQLEANKQSTLFVHRPITNCSKIATYDMCS
jgi:hypothetical protein